MKAWFEKERLKKVPQMLVAVIIMGVCVSLLKLTSFGPDPCSAMNYGMSAKLGLSLGTYQLILNTVVFIIVYIIDKNMLGLGSFGNMILVGYAADITSAIVLKIWNVETVTDMKIRVLLMIPSLIVFVFAAAVYMNSNLGTAPYDAVSFLIHKKLFTDRDRKVSFRVTRIVYDTLVTIFAYLIHGEVGLVTILMVPTLGPAVDFVAKLFNKDDNNDVRKNER